MTPLWNDNISIMYEKKYLFEVIPSKGFDLNRKLNSLFRLSIYYSIIIYLLNQNKGVLLIPFGVAIFTIIISKNLKLNEPQSNMLSLNEGNRTENDMTELLDSDCRVPTDDNPFMNPTLYGDNNSVRSCNSYNNKSIQNNINNRFDKGLYKDSNDIFGKNNSQRQFYTVASKSYPNDQDSFKKWLYSTPPTCKEGNGLQCSANGYGTPGGNGSTP